MTFKNIGKIKTFRLLADLYEPTLTIMAGTSVTIDLNGKKVGQDSNEGKITITTDGNLNLTDSSGSNGKIFANGTFSSDPSAFLSDGYFAYEKQNKWQLVGPYTFFITEKETGYDSLSAVQGAIDSNCIVYMLKDYVQNGGIEFLDGKESYKVILDLCGHKLAPTSWFDVHSTHTTGGYLTIKNGTFGGNARIYMEKANAYLILEGVTFDREDNSKNKFIMFSNGNGKVELKNCTIIGDTPSTDEYLFGNCQDGGAYTNCTVNGNISALYVGDINGGTGTAGTTGFAGAGGIAGLVVYRSQVFENCQFNGTLTESGVVVEPRLVGGYNE